MWGKMTSDGGIRCTCPAGTVGLSCGCPNGWSTLHGLCGHHILHRGCVVGITPPLWHCRGKWRHDIGHVTQKHPNGPNGQATAPHASLTAARHCTVVGGSWWGVSAAWYFLRIFKVGFSAQIERIQKNSNTGINNPQLLPNLHLHRRSLLTLTYPWIRLSIDKIFRFRKPSDNSNTGCYSDWGAVRHYLGSWWDAQGPEIFFETHNDRWTRSDVEFSLDPITRPDPD